MTAAEPPAQQHQGDQGSSESEGFYVWRGAGGPVDTTGNGGRDPPALHGHRCSIGGSEPEAGGDRPGDVAAVSRRTPGVRLWDSAIPGPNT